MGVVGHPDTAQCASVSPLASAQYRISIHYWVFSTLVVIGGQSRLGEVIMTNGCCRRESHRHWESMLFFLSPLFGFCKVEEDGGNTAQICDSSQAAGWGEGVTL